MMTFFTDCSGTCFLDSIMYACDFTTYTYTYLSYSLFKLSTYYNAYTFNSYRFLVDSSIIGEFSTLFDNRVDPKYKISALDKNIVEFVFDYKPAHSIGFTNVLILILLKFFSIQMQDTFNQLMELVLSFTNDFFAAYFFYVIILAFVTILTYLLGIKGVYTASLFGILYFWIVQLRLMNTIILNNTNFVFNSNFYIDVFGNTKFNVALILNYITFSFLFLTTTIGFFAIIYSLIYFKNEPHADRFVILLNWFIISMSLLVISDNAILMYLGWELIGLTSFFLINFWSLRRGTMKASFKAFVFNKFSDLFLLIFLVYMILHTKTQLTTVWICFFETFAINNYDLTVVTLCLIIAASIKSAQIIGHLWLPDSMEAPIPASALIHSATLVSAGIFLLLKFQTIVSNSCLFSLIGILGAVTALYGAVVSSAQTDVKKLLAYSTISHCGFLFVTIYLNNINLTLLYLYLHGFFKALTFFCVGNLVKIAKGSQDTRKMGALYSLIPADSVLLIFCCINLGGLPLTVGFYFKHVFQVIMTSTNVYWLAAPFLILAMLCGFIYSYRLIFYSLFDLKKGPEYIYSQFNKYLYLNNSSYKYFSNSNLLSLINFSVLILFAVVYYYNYSLYMLNYNINFNISQSALILDFSNLKDHRYNNIYNNALLFIFYTALLLVIFIVNVVSNKRVFSDTPMLMFIIYFIFSSLLLVVSFKVSLHYLMFLFAFCSFFILCSIIFRTLNNYKEYVDSALNFFNTKVKPFLMF